MAERFAGRFELLAPIASGGMGTVWLARDHQHDPERLLAAKILRESDASSLLRFVREQSVRIDHPHVVTPLAWAGTDERVLFTMPLVRGGSVSTLINDFGALPLSWVGALLDQALAGLEAVHATGVVHRDVKPANLLLEPTGRAGPHLRVTDFGIAAHVDEPRLTRAWSAIGSPGYMAPEQLRGADPDPRQDVYAVGVVGLEMLGGGRPRVDASAHPLAPPVPNLPTQLPEPTALARRLVEVLRRAAAPDPDDRPATAAALRAELAALGLDRVPVGADEQVEVFDQLAELVTEATVPNGAEPPLAAPRTPASPTTRREPSTANLPRPATAPPRRVLPGVLLLLLGLLCLVAALVVGLTA